MTAFVWQSLLLLGLAYVLGCWIACLARRMVDASTGAATSVNPMHAGAIAGAAAAGSAIRQAPIPPPQVVRQPVPVPAAVRDAFRRADTLEPSPDAARPPSAMPPPQPPVRPHQSSGSVDRFERALSGPSGASAAAAVRTGKAGKGVDDLKRIRMIDADLEATLHKLGIRTFAEIGAWKPADVTRISQALGYKGRVEQENWIEQAQILASGKDTYYSSRLGLANVTERAAADDRKAPAATVKAPAAVAPTRPAPPPTPTSGPRAGVEGATATAAAMAAAAAAARVAPGAAPSAAAPATPPAKPAPASGSVPSTNQPPDPKPATPSRENVQATETARPPQPAARVQTPSQTAPSVPLTTSSTPAQPVTPAAASAKPATTPTPVAAGQTDPTKPTAAKPTDPAPTPAESSANRPAPAQTASSSVPVTKPASSPSSVPAVAAVVGSASVAGAAVASLAAGAKETAPTRPSVPVVPADGQHKTPPTGSAASPPPLGADRPAVQTAAGAAGSSDQEPPRSDVAYLRSVRSDGMRGPQSAFDARAGELDDLKRIRGIGVLIEKKLNSMGVTRYEQIAKWTSTDIDRVSHVLDFRGRIERENWVEQARILASGGQTEFSRRADRGEFGGV